MKRPGVILTIFFGIVVAFGLFPYAVKRLRADTASQIDVAKVQWLGSRSDALLSLSTALISASESHDMKDAARSAYSLLNDYVLIQNSVKNTDKRQIPWNPDEITKAHEKLYSIGWPASDIPAGPRRVILPPSNH